VSSLAAEILKAVQNTKPGNRTWFDALPDDAKKELDKVRSLFDPAVHQKRAFVRAVREAAQKRGWSIAGEKQVSEWLVRKT